MAVNNIDEIRELAERLKKQMDAVGFDPSVVENRHTDVQFGELSEQKMDLYLPPKGEGPFPRVMLPSSCIASNHRQDLCHTLPFYLRGRANVFPLSSQDRIAVQVYDVANAWILFSKEPNAFCRALIRAGKSTGIMHHRAMNGCDAVFLQGRNKGFSNSEHISVLILHVSEVPEISFEIRGGIRQIPFACMGMQNKHQRLLGKLGGDVDLEKRLHIWRILGLVVEIPDPAFGIGKIVGHNGSGALGNDDLLGCGIIGRI